MRFDWSDVRENDRLRHTCSNDNCAFSVRGHAGDPQGGFIFECPICGHEVWPGSPDSSGIDKEAVEE